MNTKDIKKSVIRAFERGESVLVKRFDRSWSMNDSTKGEFHSLFNIGKAEEEVAFSLRDHWWSGDRGYNCGGPVRTVEETGERGEKFWTIEVQIPDAGQDGWVTFRAGGEASWWPVSDLTDREWSLVTCKDRGPFMAEAKARRQKAEAGRSSLANIARVTSLR